MPLHYIGLQSKFGLCFTKDLSIFLYVLSAVFYYLETITKEAKLMRIIALFFFLISILFWSDWDAEAPRIESCSMSGDGRRIVLRVNEVTSGGAWPNGLTLDYNARRIYWVDARYVILKCCLDVTLRE